MYDRVNARDIQELLLPMSRRSGGRGVFFVRVCGWGDRVREGLWSYHQAALQKGVIIEGQIANPDERQMSYLRETLGSGFEPSEAFLLSALARWMPRLDERRRGELAHSLLERFDELRRGGKTESILRNIYFKVMCWMYYRFERVTPFLGDDDPPRVLYETDAITAHELMLLRILNAIGADVMLVEPRGDDAYLKRDPQSAASQLLVPADTPFPKDFSLKGLRKEMAQASKPRQTVTPVRPGSQTANVRPGTQAAGGRPANRQGVATPPRRQAVDPYAYFKKPGKEACVNAWMKQASYEEILTPPASRGEDPALFYNAFVRVRGAQDKTTYLGDLHAFYVKFQATGRKMFIIEGDLPLPDPVETEQIQRRAYQSAEEMAVDLAYNLPTCANVELTRMIQRAFVTTLLRAREDEPSLNRLKNTAVYLLCWIRRYHGSLFQGYRDGDVPCFVKLGGCASRNEALYPLFLSQLPVDVLVLAPDLNRPCALEAPSLLELSGQESLPVKRFPRDAGSLQVQTVASHAENELTDVLFGGDSGLYRNRQFDRAEALTLRTTYDEMFLLWNQELRYRTGFTANDQLATVPVVYAKVSGVEDGKTADYWQKIKQLLGDDTYLGPRMPMITPGEANPYMKLAMKALRKGRVNREVVRGDAKYPFGIIRREMQEHIFDKVQLMLDRRLIAGTFENGTEYTVLATVLNMDKKLVRMLQGFDFTKKNPKLVCVAPDAKGASLEDAILITFLNLAGFDIALFVPTGYQNVERYLRDNFPVEHQIGEYQFDLTVPDFKNLPAQKGRSWFNTLFPLKRGN